jgi:hypothetical protein
MYFLRSFAIRPPIMPASNARASSLNTPGVRTSKISHAASMSAYLPGGYLDGYVCRRFSSLFSKARSFIVPQEGFDVLWQLGMRPNESAHTAAGIAVVRAKPKHVGVAIGADEPCFFHGVTSPKMFGQSLGHEDPTATLKLGFKESSRVAAQGIANVWRDMLLDHVFLSLGVDKTQGAVSVGRERYLNFHDGH